jgi:hypothetical protein
MASGILGKADLVNDTNTAVFTASAVVTVCSINVCNRNATSANVSIAIDANTNPANSSYIEFNATVPAGGIIERTGIVLQTAQKVIVNSTANNMSVNVYGLES